jgi:hypothetical protein
MLKKTFNASRLGKLVHHDRNLQLVLVGQQSPQKRRFTAPELSREDCNGYLLKITHPVSLSKPD